MTNMIVDYLYCFRLENPDGSVWHKFGRSDTPARRLRSLSNWLVNKQTKRELIWTLQTPYAVWVELLLHKWLDEYGFEQYGDSFKLKNLTPDEVKEKAKQYIDLIITGRLTSV